VASIAITLPTLAADPTFFPKAANDSDSKQVWTFIEKWYGGHLKAMKEPSIYQLRSDKKVERFRFLWLHTFHKPVAIRIEKKEAEVKMRVVRLSGQGGYDPGHIDYDKTIAVTSDQWDRFSKLLVKTSFWGMPREEKLTSVGPDGTEIVEVRCDGSQWVLEGLKKGKYHVVDRWTPSDGSDRRKLDEYVKCCQYLLDLSKLQIPKKDYY
jgi:hypothetical protein